MSRLGACPRIRSIVLYDIHPGTRACRTDRLLDFPHEHESDFMVLIGGGVDFGAVEGGSRWMADASSCRRATSSIRSDATIREIDGLNYANCGDRVDCRGGGVAHRDRRLEPLHPGGSS